MSHHHNHPPPRRILTPPPLLPISRKRKEREPPLSYGYKSSAPPPSPVPKPSKPAPLLAGYMALEFLTKGTLFGQKFDPARAEAVLLSGASDWRRQNKLPPPPPTASRNKKENQSYADVAKILKSDGVHIPGVVNPTQLAGWIKM